MRMELSGRALAFKKLSHIYCVWGEGEMCGGSSFLVLWVPGLKLGMLGFTARVSVLLYLLSMCDALGLSPNTAKGH